MNGIRQGKNTLVEHTILKDANDQRTRQGVGSADSKENAALSELEGGRRIFRYFGWPEIVRTIDQRRRPPNGVHADLLEVKIDEGKVNARPPHAERPSII